MTHKISRKIYSCKCGAFRKTKSQPNVVLLDRERAAARVETHVHRNYCQENSQRSLAITFYCRCRLHSTTLLSPLGFACLYRVLGPTHLKLVRDLLLAICVCYCISLFHIYLSVWPLCKFLQEWQSRGEDCGIVF